MGGVVCWEKAHLFPNQTCGFAPVVGWRKSLPLILNRVFEGLPTEQPMLLSTSISEMIGILSAMLGRLPPCPCCAAAGTVASSATARTERTKVSRAVLLMLLDLSKCGE